MLSLSNITIDKALLFIASYNSGLSLDSSYCDFKIVSNN